jgi:hypothetical protein
MTSPKEAVVVNIMKLVVVIVGVILLGIAVWMYLPVEVETGTVTVCNDSHHEGDREISRDTEIKRVLRYQVDDYQVIERQEVCASCQEKIEAERREAERQARIARIRSAVSCRFGIQGGGMSELSLMPGQRLTRLNFTIENNGSEPIPGGNIKLLLPSVPPEIILDPEDYTPWGVYMRQESEQRKKAAWDSWKILTADGWLIKRAINPVSSQYYERDIYYSEEEFNCLAGLKLSPEAKPGSDIMLSGYMLIDGQRVPAGTITIHVMHP